MSYDFTEFNQRAEGVYEWLKKEFSVIRTGRASAQILDNLMIEAYGVKTPINQNANISVEDAKTLRISPWDKTLIPEIEKGVSLLDLGVSTSADEDGVRVIFPDLTTENREKLARLAKTKTEEAKISLRNERSTIVKDIDNTQKAGEISDDESKQYKDELQKLVDDFQSKLDELTRSKEEEILN